MSLRVSRGGKITYQTASGDSFDVSSQAIEYLFEGVELDRDVLLRDLLLILKKNPILIDVFARLRAEEILEDALEVQTNESHEYGIENIEYLELDWGFSLRGDDLLSIWPKMSFSGIGHELQEPLQTDYAVFPAGARQDWSLEFCAPRELAGYPVRINSGIKMKPDCQPKLIDLGRPDLGKVIEGVLYCLSWFGSKTDREETKSRILAATEENDFHEIDVDDHLKELGEMIAKIDEKDNP